MKIIVLLYALLLLPSLGLAQSWQAVSSDKQIAVLELSTSEGCGLCPAADRWVNALPELGITEQQLIVLGFHIDYLNNSKGWVDRFASPVFSDRQRQQARLNLYQTVYTPAFFLSGELIHNWRDHLQDVVQLVNRYDPEAAIELMVTHQQQQLIINSHIEVSGVENRCYAQLFLAITESDIISKVMGGDNAGMTMNHQHLVRKWLGPFPLNSDGETDLTTSLSIEQDWNLNKANVVAVVQNLEDGFVLQGLQLPLNTAE